MTTPTDKAILSGADNRPPMLEKDMYDSWKSIMELYMMNRQHGRMILESVENGPLIWPSIEENGVTRPKKYSELSATEAIQADCDIKARNIILQGLPPKVYALVSNYKVAKELWERIQLLMQGTSLTKQEREYALAEAAVQNSNSSAQQDALVFNILLSEESSAVGTKALWIVIEKVLVITALKDDLRKLKGKALVDNAITKHTIDPEMLTINVEPITLKLLNKKRAHSSYIKHTQEEAAVLRDLVEHVKANYPLDHPLEYAFRSSKLFSGTVKFGNDHVAKILGYGDYQIGNVTISRVLYQICRRPLLYVSCQMPQRLSPGYGTDVCSHVNFGCKSNHLARQGLVRGLPKLKFEKDHLCSACLMSKSKKKPHKPKSEDTNQENLYLLHIDLCGLMRVTSVNGKKYILVIVDDYSRFIWVKCLRSKDEAPDFIIKFLKMIQVKLDEMGGILKNKACLVARGYRQEEGINFERRSFAPVARLDSIDFSSHMLSL
ncbi:integrase, catalytic region, zinc finger, CCHC-type containing protein [Tanacetum coccineum]|uniref:Integrase, catalytic region, zinc finger, CCHC-type containing protein n=1 Tax=Tanacetum coccineum TaxID=301880 RepID=A0ABQ4YR97_9ASTR